MELATHYFEIPTIVQNIQKGKFVLPEFQREFQWNPPKVADLMRTVARLWPAGSMLVMKADGELKLSIKPLKLAPASLDPEFYILDGQQRITSLFHVFTDQGADVYYIDLGEILREDVFDDEHLRFEKRSKFEKRYNAIENMVADRVLKVCDIHDDEKWGEWCDYVPDKEERSAYRKLRATLLPGLISKNYRLPAIGLDRDVPLPAIAKIFETVNRTGVQLRLVDLMVAKLYPYDFKLRDKVEQARDNHPILAKFGFEGMEALQLIALKVHFEQRARRVAEIECGTSKGQAFTIKIKGIRQGDILALDPEDVVTRWDDTLTDLVRAYTFLRERCGVASPAIAPPLSMTLVLADALSAASQRTGFKKDLELWYWRSAFSQSYSQGANTQAVKDAKELREWRVAETAQPETVAAYNTMEAKADLVGSLFIDSRTRNEVALRAALGLLVKRNAEDWLLGKRIVDISDQDLEIHHIFPDKYLKNHGVEDRNRVANFTVLSKGSNARLGDLSPSKVMTHQDLHKPALDTHRLPVDAYAANDYEDFIRKRAASLAEIAQTVL